MSEQSQKTTGIRDARTLGIPKMLLLGIQHMFAMFGATILVPILTNVYFEGEGLSVQVTLICAGLGTLFFHLCSKMKVPAFLGSSFAFLGGFSAVAALDTGIFADMTMGEKLPYACGGIVVAGLLYLILALIVKIVGVRKVMRFLPPVVTGPMIILIGLSLAGSAVTNASQNWLLAIVALAIIIIVDGILKLQYAVDFYHLESDKWWIELIGAVVMVVIGIIALLNPFSTSSALIVFIGIALMIEGLWDFISLMRIVSVTKKAGKAIKNFKDQVDAVDMK